MLSDRYEVSVLTADVYDADKLNLACEVFQDSKIIKTVFPINTDNDESPVKLNQAGILKFLVRSNLEIYSISVHRSLLSEGLQWLPLFTTKFKHDLITSIPIKVEAPRLLILINSPIKLHSVHEVPENSDTEICNHSFSLSESEEELMPQIDLWNSNTSTSEAKFIYLENQSKTFEQESHVNDEV